MVLLLCSLFLLMTMGMCRQESDEGAGDTGVVAMMDSRKPMDLDRAYLLESLRMGRAPGRDNIALLCTHALSVTALGKSSA